MPDTLSTLLNEARRRGGFEPLDWRRWPEQPDWLQSDTCLSLSYETGQIITRYVPGMTYMVHRPWTVPASERARRSGRRLQEKPDGPAASRGSGVRT